MSLLSDKRFLCIDMIISCYRLSGAKNPLEKQCLSDKEIVGLIESNDTLTHNISDIMDINIKKHIEEMTYFVQQFCENSCKFQVDFFLVPYRITSNKNNEHYCDGFAYISKKPTIVVSLYTDIKSVMCHELCHIIIYALFPQSIYLKSDYIEVMVEVLECIMHQTINLKHYEEFDESIKAHVNNFFSQPNNIKDFLQKEFLDDC